MKKVLVVRNDKIGDFMLAWPALAVLAQSGQLEVSVLVPAYTADLARLCPSVHHIVLDPRIEAEPSAQDQLLNQLKSSAYDAAIALFSNWRNASLLRRAKIPYRLAPATKFAQILYTDRVTQRRSQSLKPEWEYNLELAQHYLERMGLPISAVHPPYLRVTQARRLEGRAKIARETGLDFSRAWMVVHAGSGGSAVNLSSEQYLILIARLSERFPHAQVLLSAGPSELDLANSMAQALSAQGVSVGVMNPDYGLKGLVAALDNADLMIAGSTGPLHIAGALDRPTVGFFPARRSGTALRWQTLNTPQRHLAIQAPLDRGAQSFDGLDLQAVSQQIGQFFREMQSCSRVFAGQA